MDDTTAAEAKPEPGPKDIDDSLLAALQSLPKIPSYAACKKVATAFLGPLARIWRKGNVIEVGYQKGDQRIILGVGGTYEAAMKHSALTLSRSIVELRKSLEARHANAGSGGEGAGVGDGPAPLPAG